MVNSPSRSSTETAPLVLTGIPRLENKCLMSRAFSSKPVGFLTKWARYSAGTRRSFLRSAASNREKSSRSTAVARAPITMSHLASSSSSSTGISPLTALLMASAEVW